MSEGDSYHGLSDSLLVGMNADSRRAYFRFRVWVRDECRCGICGEYVQFSDLELDHVVFRAEGGAATWENLRATHAACNRARKPVYRKPHYKRWDMIVTAVVPEAHMTTGQLAAFLRVKPVTVRKFVRDGKIDAVRVTTRRPYAYAFSPESVRRFVDSLEVVGAR